MNKPNFWELQRSIGFEFSRYILKHPEFAKQIPANALIVFQIENNPEFNKLAMKTAKLNKEPGQKILTVEIEKLLPPFETRLVNPHLELSLIT
ncbi:MAG: hypothetical protein CVU77_08605 [Elusimicrobia bacterium HGW-Elusimicrobia-1]|jgi:hypothetical protein|nr:MAG: hypothetical protein CVU77_08605 [Elusimicrobia bacterium HGW-Elusimicrobia-1]